MDKQIKVFVDSKPKQNIPEELPVSDLAPAGDRHEAFADKLADAQNSPESKDVHLNGCFHRWGCSRLI